MQDYDLVDCHSKDLHEHSVVVGNNCRRLVAVVEKIVEHCSDEWPMSEALLHLVHLEDEWHSVVAVVVVAVAGHRWIEMKVPLQMMKLNHRVVSTTEQDQWNLHSVSDR